MPKYFQNISAPRVPHLLDVADQALRNFYPGYLAMVMATGIISNAFFFLSWFALSQILFVINLIAYPVLLLLYVARLLRHTRAFWADMVNPKLVFSFFTIVAASGVFGLQLDLRGYADAAIAIWLFAFTLWLLLLYFSFAVLTFLDNAQNANVVHGGWLIAIVGTQSLVLLGLRVAAHLPGYDIGLIVLAHMLWGIGLALYAIFVTLFSYRIFFFRFAPEDLSPLLWVVMGAAAISANAGTSLLLTNVRVPFLADTKPFIDGVTMMIWAWGTWWIPLLIFIGLWKHIVAKVPLDYTPALWSLVFPLGMYSVSTFRFSLATEFPFLQHLGRHFVWIAAAVWVLTFAAMVVSNIRFFREKYHAR
ncbi:MAG TPA: tellurite resistance/C4-dicarboxylate transporter family protein [Rhizomicrobium sp.]|nr:tellurite resistance/C4-dicarboxylate transporter family protein [Rhizomicrobium sp.]